MGTGTPNSSAQASISPQERAGVVQTYKIPPGPMASALNSFADANGLHLLYDASVTQRLKTPGLSGSFSAQEGLDHLLVGTGLSYRIGPTGHTVSIILAQNNNGTRTDAAPAGAEQLPTIDVGAAQPVQAGPGGEGQGTGPGLAATGNGTGPGGYGGAGAAQDPYNKSYVLEKASTATKTNTPVMETPVNVQSVSQQVLQDQQATTLSTALQNVSGVSVVAGSQGGAASIFGNASNGILLRGFATSNYYRDGFRIDSGSGYDNLSQRQFANISTVEVLKGPGAILYGFSDPGGILNIVTKEPLDSPYYAVQQQVGSLAFYRTSIDATGPLNTDKSLLYRVNMSYENNGAPFGSEIDHTHAQSIFIAPVIKWNIDASTWVKLEAEYGHNRSGYYFPFDPLVNGALVNVPRNFNYGQGDPNTSTNLFAALSWSHQFDRDWSIKQQIAYSDNDVYTNGLSGTFPYFIFPAPPLDLVSGGLAQNEGRTSTYSTNVDITGHLNTFGAEHTLLLGGDYYRTTGFTANIFSGPGYVSLYNPNLGFTSNVSSCSAQVNFDGPCAPSSSIYAQTSAGLYLQDQVKLPYNFFFMAGARYQYVNQTGATNSSTGGYGGPNELAPSLPVTGQALTPRFGLLWRPQQWLSLYGNYTEGFGPQPAGTLIYPGQLAPPSGAKSWEAGAKIELFDGKIRANADYFELVKTNVPYQDPNHPFQCGGGPCELVAGAARSTGPEFDVQGEILPGWKVIANYTNDDVRFTKINPATVGPGGPGAGERFFGVPRNQASLWTTYEFQNDSALKGLKIGAGYHYFGSTPVGDITNPPFDWRLIPSYGTVDLMAAYSWNYAGTKMTAQLNVTNLLDRTYYTGVAVDFASPAPGAVGGVYRSYGAPFAVVGSLRAELDKGSTPPPWLLPVASAAPSLSTFTWTGFYVGGQMGYGWGLNDGSVSWATAQGQIGPGFQGSQIGSGAHGVIGGAHAGYNQQFDRWVVGLEGSIDGTTLTKNIIVPGPNLILDPNQASGIGGTVTGRVQTGVQGSVRARAGYAFGRLLPYVTGGVAIGSFNSDAQLFGVDLDGATSFAASGAKSATRVGWTLGGGLEYAVNNHWSLRGEYRYTDFGHIAIATDPSAVGAAFALDRKLEQHQVQVGFSYKFGPLVPEPMDAPRIVKGPAVADNDLPKFGGVAPSSGPFVMNWTGFYAGLHIGYGWGLNDGSITYATPGGLAGQSNLSSSAIVSGGGTNSNGDATGVIGGAHLGYNWLFDRWVAGLEGSIDPTLMSRGISITAPNATAVDPVTLANDIGATATGGIWSTIQGSVRARAGYAFDRMMVYGTGGVALGSFGSNFQVFGIDLTGAPFYAADQRSSTRVGWTLGGGVEYAINPHWTVRGEYRYTDFGHMSEFPAATSMGVAYTADRHLDQNQVQVGFSYKFGEDVPVSAKY